MFRIISVILLSLMLIIPTVVLYQNNNELTENYEMLIIDFDNLEDDLFNLEKEKHQLDNDLTSLQIIHDSLMRDYEESQNTLTQLEQTLENINLQKTSLESEIQQRKDEILILVEEGNAKQSEIISLTNDLTRRINDLDVLTTRSLELETQISIQDENIENQKQTIGGLEDERTELIEQRNEITEERNQLVVENTQLTEDNDELVVENIQLTEDNARLNLLLNENALENRDEILRLGIDSRQSVVRIGHTGGWLVGTGFLVSNNGCIITNLHVTNAATNNEDQMRVIFPDGREYTGDLLKEGSLNRGTGHNIDIALVKISATTIPLPLSNTIPQYEDTAILIGHPGELGAWVIAAGSYNGFSPYSWATNDYLFSLPSVFGGSSGSPILNMNGEVIALNWGSIVHTPLNQNNDFIVWKDNLGKFIMENQYSLAETSIDIISFLSDTECRI